MNAEDFLDRLSDQQRAAYVDGAIEMMTYGMASGGLADKATCTLDWYYRGPGPQQLTAILSQYRDLPVTGIIQTLVKRQCAR